MVQCPPGWAVGSGSHRHRRLPGGTTGGSAQTRWGLSLATRGDNQWPRTGTFTRPRTAFLGEKGSTTGRGAEWRLSSSDEARPVRRGSRKLSRRSESDLPLLAIATIRLPSFQNVLDNRSGSLIAAPGPMTTCRGYWYGRRQFERRQPGFGTIQHSSMKETASAGNADVPRGDPEPRPAGPSGPSPGWRRARPRLACCGCRCRGPTGW
jgi:hypothetical protein